MLLCIRKESIYSGSIMSIISNEIKTKNRTQFYNITTSRQYLLSIIKRNASLSENLAEGLSDLTIENLLAQRFFIGDPIAVSIQRGLVHFLRYRNCRLALWASSYVNVT